MDRSLTEDIMATNPMIDTSTANDPALDAMIEQDPDEPGRHNARLAETGTHVWVVLATLRRTDGDVAATANEWHLPEAAVRAAVRYYERHRDVFEAFFLLQEEEARAWDSR